ncbi:uncharacterized protein LOC124168014 isoform X2 [Ischnura elegans]|uniref:uncharacterized protein LOC124168014 isoform X2 n=1 Tax=Ischnura elegans TaxID=197161 RepID=UPI001ED8B0ED|nr:uncharacterized protein LOC124168014 isoform X2 [Ischnura elegans]
MVGCSAINCSNRSDQGFKTFRIPRDPVRRQAWINFIGREGWIPGSGASICEAHFEDSAYELHRADGLKKLKQNAVPTISVASPVIRSKRKQTVQPRIEFSFDEGDQVAFIAEESVAHHHVENEKFQTVSSSECGTSGMGERSSQMKELKSLHIMGIVDKPKPKEVDVNPDVNSEFSVIEKRDCESTREQVKRKSDNGVVPVAVVKFGRQLKPTGRVKGVKARKKQGKAVIMKSMVVPEKVTLDDEGAVHLGDTSGVIEKSVSRCFVCGKVIAPGFDVQLNIPADASRTILRECLEAVLNYECRISDREVLCRRCSSLLNYIDRTEAEVALVKGAISVCVKQELEDKPCVSRSEQLLERFSKGIGEKNYVMDLEELFLEQTDAEDNDQENKSHSVAVDESLYDEDNNSTKESEKVTVDTSQNVNGGAEEIDYSKTANYEADLNSNTLVCSGVSIEEERTMSGETDSKCDLIGESIENVENGRYSKASNIANSSTTNEDMKQYLGGQQKMHECKICSFKTGYESVMIWHLRGHMKSHRWCDFCSEALPEKESVFTQLKKIKPRLKRSIKKIRSKPRVILPAIPVDTTSIAQVSLSSLSDMSSETPVVLVDTLTLGNEFVQEAEEKGADNVQMENIDGSIIFMNESALLSETAEILQNPLPVEEGATSIVGKSQTEHFCNDSSFSPSVQETEALEIYCGILRPPGIELSKVDNSDADVVLSECLNNCCDVDESNPVDSLSGDPCCIPTGECAPPTEDLEDSMETNFLDTLTSQPVTKYPEMLSEICDEATDQSDVSPVCDMPDDNMSSNDVNFSRSNAIGESLALAYENSVAALMCQSDDSDEMLY